MEKKDNAFLTDVKKIWKYIKKARMSLLGYGMVSILEAASSIVVPLITAKVILSMTSSAVKQLLLSAVLLLIVKLISSILVFFKAIFYRKAHFIIFKVKVKEINAQFICQILHGVMPCIGP